MPFQNRHAFRPSERSVFAFLTWSPWCSEEGGVSTSRPNLQSPLLCTCLAGPWGQPCFQLDAPQWFWVRAELQALPCPLASTPPASWARGLASSQAPWRWAAGAGPLSPPKGRLSGQEGRLSPSPP